MFKVKKHKTTVSLLLSLVLILSFMPSPLSYAEEGYRTKEKELITWFPGSSPEDKPEEYRPEGLPPDFHITGVRFFQDQLIIYEAENDKGVVRIGLMDDKGAILKGPIYSPATAKMRDFFRDEGLLVLAEQGEDEEDMAVSIAFPNGKYGAVDTKGEVVIPFKYDRIEARHYFLRGYIKQGEEEDAKKLWAAFDGRGRELLPPIYDEVYVPKEKDGFITASRNGEIYIFDSTGKEIERFSNQFLVEDYWSGKSYRTARLMGIGEGVRAYIINGRAEYRDSKGNLLFEPIGCKEATPFHRGYAVLWKDEKYAIINKKGQFLTDGFDLFYADILDECDGIMVMARDNKGSYFWSGNPDAELKWYDKVKVSRVGNVVVSNGAKYGLLSREGRELLPIEYDDLYRFFRGFLFIKKNGKLGTADVWGRILIKPEHDSLSSFSEGLSLAGDVIREDDKGEVYQLKFLNAKEHALLEFESRAVPALPFDGGRTVVFSYLPGSDKKRISRMGIIKNPYYEGSGFDKAEAKGEKTAQPTNSKVKFNNKTVEIPACMIEGRNYVKLRDFAALLADTDMKFSVEWLQNKNSIFLETAKDYAAVGGELVHSNKGDRKAQPSTYMLHVNNIPIRPTCYLIDGNNYFQLRDLADKLNIKVGWDENTRTVILAPNK